MIFLGETTNAERKAISNAVWPIFTDLEHAQTLLNTCLEDHFEDYPQKAITESEAEKRGRMAGRYASYCQHHPGERDTVFQNDRWMAVWYGMAGRFYEQVSARS